MSFDVAAEAYDRFMGRYSAELAPPLVDFAGVGGAHKVLDVGCGPGALTAELVRRFGQDSVAAVDPSERFVSAACARYPGVDVRHSPAEDLPFADGVFDATLAQLVVHFMSDPSAGLKEMARVTRAGGVVAACVWDSAGERSPTSAFWHAARELDATLEDESGLAGSREGQLAELFRRAGLASVDEGALSVAFHHASFDEWWEPFTLGVGPAGAYARTLREGDLTMVRERCRELLPEGPFTLTAFAWAARGVTRGDER